MIKSVALYMGAWIEIVSEYVFVCGKCVALCMSACIEIEEN